jgi:hypothetical protein
MVPEECMFALKEWYSFVAIQIIEEKDKNGKTLKFYNATLFNPAMVNSKNFKYLE